MALDSSTAAKSPGNTEIDTPPHPPACHPAKLLPFTNGAFKSYSPAAAAPPSQAIYKECMKNHAASLGGHAVDGCGEFMPSPLATASDPTSLKCAACGCHRNFHRREPTSPTASAQTAITPPFLDFRHPPLPKRFSLSPSDSPPPAAPISYAPHVIYGFPPEDHQPAPVTPTAENPVSRKRFRTKFSHEQKQRMLSFSEKVGWRMQKSDELAVEEFCREIGVTRGVLKVWMHNNKNTFGGKKESVINNINGGKSLSSSLDDNDESNGGGSKSEDTRIDHSRHFQNSGNGSNGFHFQGSNNSRASSP